MQHNANFPPARYNEIVSDYVELSVSVTSPGRVTAPPIGCVNLCLVNVTMYGMAVNVFGKTIKGINF